jgi:hypothetical protein
MRVKNYTLTLRNIAILFAAILFGINESKATTKTAILTGDWSSPLIWSPLGVPQQSDEVVIVSLVTVTISTNQSIDKVTVNANATLQWSNSSTLTIDGNLAVSGTVKMNGGNITQTDNNAIFSITNSGTFEWQPGNNTLAGATLFTNSTENFSMYSTLKIKTWYDYTNTPLGNVVSGNFGNVQMSSKTGNNTYVEWNQNNRFETHQIFGTLTIVDGWITLDRSGSISNTSIGAISLSNANSTFYAHRGNHPSGFTLNTNSISNTLGVFDGILDGNGNVTINVDGDITNTGDFKVINNDGVASTSNGNATLNVTGTFYQVDGDARIIYNIATTNSGVFTANLGNIEFDGGIFMCQYACHAGNQTCSLVVANNINASFSHGNEKFRGLGLTSLSGNNNTAKFYFSVGGNVIINATSNGAEFTTSSSTGNETDIINGTFQVNGGQTSVDYGTGQASHNSTLTVNVNLIVSSGTMNLSRLNGTTDIFVGGNVVVSGGTLSVKGGTGTANMTITGNFTQSSGTFNLHANNAVISMSPVTVTVNGDFTQSGGTINYDSNGSSVSAEDVIIIKGANFNLTGIGAATMTQAGAGTNPVFGFLKFQRQGTTTFNRSNIWHNIAQIKIVVDSGTTVVVSGGNLQLASHANAGTDYLTVKSGGVLNMNGYQIYSNGNFANSGMRVEDGGTLKIMNLFGLYDGSNSAAIKSGGNFNFYLGALSTVEYAGLINQIVTGTGAGVATTNNHKYGILKINFKGVDNVNYVYPVSSNVFVRTQLDLTAGEFFLNGYTLTVESGSSNAITRTAGYIKSESLLASNNGYIKWQNVSSGTYVFPFGKNTQYYLPVMFTPTSGTGNVMIRTRTTGLDNLPMPINPLNLSAVAAPLDPINNLIDRWWDLNAPGLTANVTVSYAGDENTLLAAYRNGSLNIEQFNNGAWTRVSNAGTGVTSGTGTATVSATSLFTSWTVSTQGSTSLPIQLTKFTAVHQNASVLLSWTTAMEVNNDFFTLEKSRDGSSFSYLAQIDGAGNSTRPLQYRYNDNQLSGGVTYYRLKQTDFDGKSTFSNTISVNLGNIYNVNDITFENVFPSPFQNEFTVLYTSSKEQKVDIKITDISGKTIASEKLQSTAGSNSYKYSGSGELPAGIYIIKLSTPAKSVTKRVVKK